MGFSVKARAQYTPRSSAGQFIAAKVTPGAIAGTNASAQRVVDYAKSIVHVRSGELRDSGKIVPATTENGKTTALAVFDADHAAYAEFGTGRAGEASPDAGKGPYKPDWPGMEPIPYLRPAMDATREQVKEEMKGSLSISLR